jgi:hypothetical protein
MLFRFITSYEFMILRGKPFPYLQIWIPNEQKLVFFLSIVSVAVMFSTIVGFPEPENNYFTFNSE